MQAAVFSRIYTTAAMGPGPEPGAAALLRAVAADGFYAVQANLISLGLASLPAYLPAGLASTFGREAERQGVRIAALSGTYNMAHPDVGVRRECRPGFRNVISAAHEMGAAMVTLCSGTRDQQDMWSFHADNHSAKAWNDLRSELEFALDAAARAGIRLALEPEPANVVADASAAARMLQQMASPHLGVVLDAANLLAPVTLAQQHAILDRAVKLLSPFLLLAHAKDIDTFGNVIAPGRGVVDLAAFVRLLRAAGYDGALVAHGFGQEEASYAARTLKNLIGECA